MRQMEAKMGTYILLAGGLELFHNQICKSPNCGGGRINIGCGMQKKVNWLEKEI